MRKHLNCIPQDNSPMSQFNGVTRTVRHCTVCVTMYGAWETPRALSHHSQWTFHETFKS